MKKEFALQGSFSKEKNTIELLRKNSFTNSNKYEIITAGVNWRLKTKDTQKRFMKYSYGVKAYIHYVLANYRKK